MQCQWAIDDYKDFIKQIRSINTNCETITLEQGAVVTKQYILKEMNCVDNATSFAKIWRNSHGFDPCAETKHSKKLGSSN